MIEWRDAGERQAPSSGGPSLTGSLRPLLEVALTGSLGQRSRPFPSPGLTSTLRSDSVIVPTLRERGQNPKECDVQPWVSPAGGASPAELGSLCSFSKLLHGAQALPEPKKTVETNGTRLNHRPATRDPGWMASVGAQPPESGQSHGGGAREPGGGGAWPMGVFRPRFIHPC